MARNVEARGGLAYESSAQPNWIRAAKAAELRARGRLVFRHGGKQIVLFSTSHGFYACNNRCPHEGYPLVEGTLSSACVLTCNWHNWKFDLHSGETLYGGDRLRTYPLEIRGDAVWIDVTEPPRAARGARARIDLEAAFRDNDYARMARELARWTAADANALDALGAAVEWSYDRMELGWTHAFAGLADWLELYDATSDPERRLACALEAISHIAEDVYREQRYPFTDRAASYDGAAFRAAIEAENEADAVAMLRGALSSSAAFEVLERDLSHAALAHYNDFGHSLIYVSKLGPLARRLGTRAAERLAVSLARSLIFATREDLVPEFRAYARALAAWGTGTDRPSIAALRRRGVDGALAATVAASGCDAVTLYQTLLAANAENLLAFDSERAERTRVPVSQNVGWLDITHGITFANAVRRQCTKFPELWPQGLLQMACFAGRNAPFARNAPDPGRWRVADHDRFLAETEDRLLDHGVGEFIVSVHWLKTALAVRDELRGGVPDRTAQLLLAGLNRFLNARIKRRHVRRTVYQARRFVARE